MTWMKTRKKHKPKDQSKYYTESDKKANEMNEKFDQFLNIMKQNYLKNRSETNETIRYSA